MKNLQLSLKKKWFEMTKSGDKTEDYRQINLYWFVRLAFQHKKVFQYCTGIPWDALFDNQREALLKDVLIKKDIWAFKPFDYNIMTLGYPPKEDANRILKLPHAGIEISEGNPNWGAEPGKLYFVIKHGKRL